MAQRVWITDVSPRDGLQNERGVITTAAKLRLIESLSCSGLDEIEITSFVSAKWVPQLGDAAQVCAGAARLVAGDRGRTPGGVPASAGHSRPAPPAAPPLLSALVPNAKGLEGFEGANTASASAVGRPVLGKVCLFTAASETFSHKNTNAGIRDSIDRWQPVLQAAWRHRWSVKLYVSCAFGCPFEGQITPEQVRNAVELCTRAAQFAGQTEDSSAGHADTTGGGFAEVEISLGDTIGVGTPDGVRQALDAVHRTVSPHAVLNLHLHDTFGRASECVRAGLAWGVRRFDGSVAGLGGCPYASKSLPDGTIQRAPGNLSTETLVRVVREAGYDCGVDEARLSDAGTVARQIVAAAQTVN